MIDARSAAPTLSSLFGPTTQLPGTLKPVNASPRTAVVGDLGSLGLAMLDEIDHAVLLLDGHRVLHANRAARQALMGVDERAAMRLEGASLVFEQRSDGALIDEAIAAARARGVRKLLTIGRKDSRIGVAVVPMLIDERDDAQAVMLVLGRHQVCSELTVFWYARSFGLTQAESLVLQGLCKGLGPNDIATAHAVAISTVRTQLAAIRAKTQTASLRDLVNQVACLPPLVHALAQGHAH